MKVPFNQPILAHFNQSMHKVSGDGEYTKKCTQWFQNQFHVAHVLLTTSCTHALEMAAILCGIGPGDEVIMPSYTFSSTANAFVLRGATIRFVDIRPDTMNLDEKMIEQAIGPATRAIVPVHYAGVACEMDTIIDLAKQYDLSVIEDAAQGVMSLYKGGYLGTLGDMGAYSFHETKNYMMGEGGAFLTNCSKLSNQAEILREKGTDRSQFLRGQVDKYSWVGGGSSFLPSDILANYLWQQLPIATQINDRRLTIWQRYYDGLQPLFANERLILPTIPPGCQHNAHMFYIKCQDVDERTQLISYLKSRDIHAVFHYVPLHSTEFGKTVSTFVGKDIYTTKESERLLRLPMYYDLSDQQVDWVIESVHDFFKR